MLNDVLNVIFYQYEGSTSALLRRVQLYETNATETEQNKIKTKKRQRYYELVPEP
jgi:hypothetical protein